ESLLRIIPEAFRIAASGRPGPVLIDIPKDIQTARVTIEEWPEPGERESTEASILAPDLLDTSIAMIEAAKRPILYVGGGIIQGHAETALLALCKKADIPITTTLMGLGALPWDHPMNLGMLGMHGARYTNKALDACDLLIAVGVRFDDRRSEEHTSELQSRENLVCRLLHENKEAY